MLTPHAGELDVFGWTLNASTHQLENKTEIAASEFYAVGVDPAGRIYAYDEEGAKATHHVDVFAAGAGAHASPVEEFGAGTIGESTGIAYSPHGGGTVYVTDATSNQVHVYTPTKYALTVTKNGTGSGTVECNTGSGPGACAAEYNEGTKVKLTETAAGGSTFAGWSEACTGTGSCEVTITAATKVTATFNLTPVTKEGKLTVSGSATVSGGKALLKLSCSAAGACSGKLELTIQIKQRHRLKTVVIGRVSYGIAAGQSQTVKVKLSGVANHLLKQFKTLDATLTGPGGLKRTVKLKLKLSQEASLEKRKA